MDNAQKKKKFLRTGIAVGFFSTAVAALLFSGGAWGKNIVAEGCALAVNLWNGMFRSGTNGDAAAEIDFGDGDTAASTSISDAGTDAAVGSTAAAKKNAPAKKISPPSAPVPAQNAAPTASATPASSASGTLDMVPIVAQACTIADAPSDNAAPPAVSRKIIFNEVAWMGSLAATGETAAHAGGREWIELKNNSTADVGLAGWQLLDGGGKLKVAFAEGDHISGGSFYLLARGESTFFSVPVDKIYSGLLPNTGDELALFDPQCAPSDVFDVPSGWPAGSNATKQTMERDADGGGWHASVAPGGTPRAENSVPAVVAVTPSPPSVFLGLSATSIASDTGVSSAPPPAAPAPSAPTSSSSLIPAIPASSTAIGHLVIAAVQIGGASSSNDFVKIMNPTSAAVDVAGWRLRKKSSSGADYSLRTFPDASTVAPGTTFTWANSEGGFSETAGANVSSTETLAAENSVALFDKNGTVIDEVAWGTGTGQYVEGSAYPTDPASGQVLTRNMADGIPVDTDDNATDFTLQ